MVRDARCHVYLETGDALFVDNRLVCIHASTDGEKTVTLRQPARANVVFGASRPHVDGNRLRIEMRANETVLLRLDQE